MIAILDCGMGNPGSILNMIRKAGGDAIVTGESAKLAEATAIVLPGVGAFDNGMKKLKASGLIEQLTDSVINNNIPCLAVCVGMQLLFESSEEGVLPGLGWIAGRAVKFDFSDNPDHQRLKVPHMGWNIVNPTHCDSLFKGLEEEARFYFVHSYHVVCSDSTDILAVADYGGEFCCAVRRDNIFGTQFHPEKSHRFGLTLFKNFLENVSC